MQDEDNDDYVEIINNSTERPRRSTRATRWMGQNGAASTGEAICIWTSGPACKGMLPDLINGHFVAHSECQCCAQLAIHLASRVRRARDWGLVWAVGAFFGDDDVEDMAPVQPRQRRSRPGGAGAAIHQDLSDLQVGQIPEASNSLE
jgi:hypothetical protein